MQLKYKANKGIVVVVKSEKSIEKSFRLHLGILRSLLPISLYILSIGSRETSIYIFSGVTR